MMNQINLPLVDKLTKECEKLRRENAELRRRLGMGPNEAVYKEEESSSVSQEVTENTHTYSLSKKKLSTSDKLKIFTKQFRGRQDIYAVRKKNKAGKFNYYPARKCDWDSHTYDKNKKKYKCSESCRNLELTDSTIKEHLQGKQTLGIYPLNIDDSCYWLAIDFDKETWQEDSLAYLEACNEHGVPACIERSRSGDGAHIWIFFEDRIPAREARNLGTSLLTQAQEKRHQISFKSYDRLFPNQDILPKGGYGNLIALPFQGKCVAEGNTVFVDRSFTPYENQWHYLQSIERITQADVRKIIAKISKQNGIFGSVSSPEPSEEDDPPWEKDLSESRKSKKLTGHLPASINATKSNMLYIEKKGLSSSVISALARLAAFQNPEFYKKQALRLSTHETPRIISCSKDEQKHIGLPRGCENQLQEFCTTNSIKLINFDKRNSGSALRVKFLGKLKPLQKKSTMELSKYDTGVLCATTAFGKTVVAAKMISKRKRNTLILVHRTQLMDQWKERLQQFLSISLDDIGTIGGGKNKPKGKIDIATLQSLQRKGEVKDLIANYGHIIVDECHHIPAFTFEQVLNQAKAKYVLGLTATPKRKNGDHPIIFMQCGPIRFTVTQKQLTKNSDIKHIVIPRITSFSVNGNDSDQPIATIYGQLVSDENRNEQIFNDILIALEQKRSPVVITERREHLELLKTRLEGFAKNIICLHGGLSKKERREINEKLDLIPDDQERILLATGQFLGEGFDDARLDTLFLAHPISWEGKLHQYAGRLHRDHQRKESIEIYDYVDVNVSVLLRMYEKRLKGYKAIGYCLEE